MSLKQIYFILVATISAPPTTNNSASSSSNNGDSKVPTIATTNASSKIMHPAEDSSLEEIRSRNPKYARTIPTKTEDIPSSASTSASEVSVCKMITVTANFFRSSLILMGVQSPQMTLKILKLSD